MKKTKRIITKLLLSLIYISIIIILIIGCYYLFQEKEKITPWSEAKNIEEYTYLDISKMSEKFAYDEENNVGIHFVIEKEETGIWHTYIIAINENEYEEYKAIIDYTYERTDKIPDKKRVYGYPVIVEDELKELVIKNINNFLPAENEIEITNENYEQYLTNCYLDTTKERKYNFSIILTISFGLLFLVFVLFIMTITDKGKKNKLEV